MDLRQLRYFVAAAEAGSISRAAARCGVAQPSLSQQIAKLETDLNATLFDRLGRGVELTEAGRHLLPRARRVLAEVQDIADHLADDADTGAGVLAVGAIPTMAPYLVPPVVAALRERFPACELRFREALTQDLVEALADNALDVAIMSTPADDVQIELETVGAEEMLVVAPAGHPVCSGDAVALPDLRAEPAVTLHDMHCLGQQIDEFCSARQLAGNIVCRAAQISTLLEFVRLGLGISIVPAMVAAADPHPALRYVRFESQPPAREIALAWRRGRSRSTLARAFADLIREQLSGRAPRTPASRDGSPA